MESVPLLRLVLLLMLQVFWEVDMIDCIINETPRLPVTIAVSTVLFVSIIVHLKEPGVGQDENMSE